MSSLNHASDKLGTATTADVSMAKLPSEESHKGDERHEIHKELASGRRSGQYWSLTTSQAPLAPWSPLLSHKEKEKRPCHCSESRVHKLQCGHTVAVLGNAERCAANCVGMDLGEIADAYRRKPWAPDAGIEGPPSRQLPGDVINNSRAGLKAYAETFLGVRESEEGLQKAKLLEAIMEEVKFCQQEPRRDLTGGNFECRECSSDGHRPSLSIFTYRRTPWHVMIPIREDKDAQLVRKLRQGIKPADPGRDHHKKRRTRPENSKVKNGRITKQRVNEKKKVTAQIREDTILEKIADMQLFQ